MVNRRIIGYRAHPVFKTLMQEIYECGHVRSAPADELELAEGQLRRCTKCVKGMPADVNFAEPQKRVRKEEGESPLLERLCKLLKTHLDETELARRKMSGDYPEIDAAIVEAYSALREAGFAATSFKLADR